MILDIILLVIAVIAFAIAGVVLFAATRPNHFRVERSLDINAPAEKIFPVLADLKLQREWSPWDQMDPDMKRTYSGADRGVNAVYEWDSKKMRSKGRQEITAVKPNEKIDIDLDFTRPFKASNKTEFVLRPASSGTNVTWVMSGPAPLLHRVMGFIFCSGNMIEREFDKGLIQLKAIAEK